MTLKNILRQILSILSFYGGYSLLSTHFRRGVRILCFHGINDRPENQYAVSTQDFRHQMRFLAANYDVVSMERFVTLLTNEREVPSERIAVTVDDAYRDFYQYAFPVLKEFNIPATVFVPTGFIDDDPQYANILPQKEFLSWDQIREMNQHGVDFGSHTLSHTSLTKLSRQEILSELKVSKSRIEAEIGETINGFAYPYGTLRDIDTKIERLIAEAGYTWAVTSVSGQNELGVNPFALRRTVIVSDDKLTGFKRALKGSLDNWVIMQRFGYYANKAFTAFRR